jgi:glycogen(starch) synthase
VTQHGVLEPSDRLKVVRDLLRRADALTAVSDAALQSAAQFSNHDGRQEIIANGIRPYQQPASLPGLPGLHRMVCVGRLEHEKGFDIAIRALAVARAEGLDATLTIVGCGEDRRKLEALASELGLAGSVHFRGACDNEETRRIMAGASVVLVPSRTREGFSLVAAEAALAGVPCVVSRIGGLPETVADGVTGFVVSPAQPAEFAAAAIRLFRHASLGADLGSRARARAGLKYNLDTCVEHYQQLYLSVLARAARGAGVTS